MFPVTWINFLCQARVMEISSRGHQDFILRRERLRRAQRGYVCWLGVLLNCSNRLNLLTQVYAQPNWSSQGSWFHSMVVELVLSFQDGTVSFRNDLSLINSYKSGQKQVCCHQSLTWREQFSWTFGIGNSTVTHPTALVTPTFVSRGIFISYNSSLRQSLKFLSPRFIVMRSGRISFKLLQ